MQINDSTPRESYTIAGETFKVPMPFVAGHTITDGEADSLNQTLAENVRNNLAKKVKEAKDGGSFDAEEFQLSLDEYVNDYEFGVRTGGGGRSADPLRSEFYDLARAKVKEKLKANGQLKGRKAAEITALVDQYWNSGSPVPAAQAVYDLAVRRVKERQELADSALGDLAA